MLLQTDFIKYFKYLSNIEVLEIFSASFVLLAVIVFHKKLNNINYRLFTPYSILIITTEIIVTFLAIKGKNNHKIYLIFYLIEAIMISYYYINMVSSKKFNWFVGIVNSLIVLFVWINFNEEVMNNYAISTLSLCMIVMCVFVYYIILSELKIQKLSNSVLFWFNTANIIYFSGRFFVFLFISQILDTNNELGELWQIASIAIILQRILMTVAISKAKYEN
jgi:hypothetical protein